MLVVQCTCNNVRTVQYTCTLVQCMPHINMYLIQWTLYRVFVCVLYTSTHNNEKQWRRTGCPGKNDEFKWQKVYAKIREITGISIWVPSLVMSICKKHFIYEGDSLYTVDQLLKTGGPTTEWLRRSLSMLLISLENSTINSSTFVYLTFQRTLWKKIN